MGREAFLVWLAALLEARNTPVGRWRSGPDLTDLEIELEGRRVRLRIVRTSRTR